VAALFALVDKDASGALDPTEILAFISLGSEEDEEAKKFIAEVDKNADGKISVEEIQVFFENKSKVQRW
jgi:Ca2+-binding EF-hand superfamily protein